MIQSIRNDGPAGTLRTLILMLVAMGIVGTAVMLTYHRHWEGPWQLVPWGILGGATLGLAALMVRTGRSVVHLARILGVVTIVSAAFGVWQHFDENYRTAPLARRYSDSWETMSTVGRLWTVSNGAAGHVPVWAAAILVPVGLALAAATIGLEQPERLVARRSGPTTR